MRKFVTLFAILCALAAPARAQTNSAYPTIPYTALKTSDAILLEGTRFTTQIYTTLPIMADWFRANMGLPTFSCAGSTWPKSAAAGVVTCTQPAFSNLSGSITAGVLPAFTGGDCTTSAGSVALNCTKTNGNLLVSVLTPKVDNNTALSALASTYATGVVRLGFASAGDTAPVTYTASNSACSLNSGSGDGGSQVPSADGKCWLATAGALELTAFGAKGDGSTDDTAAFTTALASGRDIIIPAKTFVVTLSSTTFLMTRAYQRLIGQGSSSVVIANGTYGKNLFTVRANYVEIANFMIRGGVSTSVVNQGGFAIFTEQAYAPIGLYVHDMVVTGTDASHGLNNFVKLDSSCDRAIIEHNRIDSLMGSTSGNGYGVLVAGNYATVNSNWFYGGSGRGRHGVYLSTTQYSVVSNNTIYLSDYEAITFNSFGAQPATSFNIVSDNKIVSPVVSANASSGGIGVYGHALANQITGNTIYSSGAKGIAIDGTGVSDLKGTTLTGNIIHNSASFGIDVIAAANGAITGGAITDSSQSSAGTYPNIRFVSDGATATTNWVISGVNIPASSVASSGVQFNATAPIPTGIKIGSSIIGAGIVTDIENSASSIVPVDGRLRYSVSLTPASTANGAAWSQGGLSIPGAVLGDTLAWSYRGYGTNCDGMAMTVSITSSNTAEVVIVNNSGGTKTCTASTLDVDVLKRTP